VELADQLLIRRMSPIATPLPKADEAAVAHVKSGGASIPAFQRLLVMNPQSFEGHHGVQTTGVEEGTVVSNV
jgi:hypothetical protein